MFFPLKITSNRILKLKPRTKAQLASAKKRSASLDDTSDPLVKRQQAVSNIKYCTNKTSVTFSDPFLGLQLTEPNVTSSLTDLKLNDKTPVNNPNVKLLILALRPHSEPVCNLSLIHI